MPDILDWQQELFDLMANERIRLSITGEMGSVDATLEIRESDGHFSAMAFALNAPTLDDAMRQVMKEFGEKSEVSRPD